MNFNPAENRDPTGSRHHQPKESPPCPTGHGTGYYMALTFGTLLSSQGPDAQKLRPRGLHLWRLSMLRPASRRCHPEGPTRWPPGPLGAKRTLHHRRGLVQSAEDVTPPTRPRARGTSAVGTPWDGGQTPSRFSIPTV